MGQFAPGPIETLSDWNAILSNGCCCAMNCPAPSMECESYSGAASFYAYAPVAEPPEDDDDLIPVLFDDIDFVSFSEEFGTVWKFNSGPGTPPNSGEQSDTITVDRSTETDMMVDNTDTSFEANTEDGVTCTFSSGSFSSATGVFGEEGVTYPGEPDVSEVCDQSHYLATSTFTAISGSGPFPLAGCPGPFAYDVQMAYNMTLRDVVGIQLSNPITPAGFRSDLINGLDEFASGSDSASNAPGWSCEASYYSTWPKMSEGRPWPLCSDMTPPEFGVDGSVTKARYRWVIDPQIVLAALSDSSDTDPAGPGPSDDVESWWKGLYYKVTWDVLTEPEGWDDTLSDSDSNPSNDPPRPGRPNRSYVQDLTWVWTGPGDPYDEESWKSPWYDLDVPGEPGIKRVVNVRYECYRSKYGTKPETSGEGVDLSEDSPLQFRFTSDRHSIHIPIL
jgi:hypothetical protein